MRSEYLEWAKTRKPARFNLASSGVTPCPLTELGARLEDLEINESHEIKGSDLYGYQPLQEAIASHCGVPADCVVATSGTSMANFLAMAALLQPGDEVLIEQPVYEPILSVARYLGADVKRFERATGLLPGTLSGRTKLIVITNLHNPTCTLLSDPELRALAGLASSVGARILVDEVYLECLYEKTRSAFHLGDAFICTGSLTKAYGVGGLRCGWIIARPEVARRMWRLKDLIDPGAPHLTEQLSVLAFRNLDRLASRAREPVAANRALLREFAYSCVQVELPVPEFGTCVFPRLKQGNSNRLFELLHDQYDTDIVPGRFFEAPDHFRLGIGGATPILAEGLQRLDAALRHV